MILLEKEVNGTTLKTEFYFDDRHIKLVKDVLECLEGKTVDVPTGNEENDLISISILDWLPVVCSKVRFDNSHGSYITIFNPAIMTLAMKLLLTVNRLPPAVIFIGEIHLSREVMNYNDAFRFVLVHEMQHTINALKYAYPATTNWKGFLFNIAKVHELLEPKGVAESIEPTIERLAELDRGQDEVPIEEELKIYEKLFGASIHTWFRGYSKFLNDVVMK
ncbi:MAG: hypothetical protein ACUZ8H_15735 [Candidatus Anammoxibacter sp.]